MSAETIPQEAVCPGCGNDVEVDGWHCADCHPITCPDCLEESDDATVAAMQQELEDITGGDPAALSTWTLREIAAFAVAEVRNLDGLRSLRASTDGELDVPSTR